MGLRALLGLDANERGTPAAPPTGRRLLYAKSDGWYEKSSAGGEGPHPPTFIQATQPTAAEVAGFPRYLWVNTSGVDPTFWVEDGL